MNGRLDAPRRGGNAPISPLEYPSVLLVVVSRTPPRGLRYHCSHCTTRQRKRLKDYSERIRRNRQLFQAIILANIYRHQAHLAIVVNERDFPEKIWLHDGQRRDAAEHYAGFFIAVPVPVYGLQGDTHTLEQFRRKRPWIGQVDDELVGVLRCTCIERIRTEKDREAPSQRVLLAQLFGGAHDIGGDRFFQLRLTGNLPAKAFRTDDLLLGWPLHFQRETRRSFQ